MTQDEFDRVTKCGALVMTPSGRVARVVKIVERSEDKCRIEVEYVETDRVLIDPIMLRPYSKPKDGAE